MHRLEYILMFCSYCS